MFQWFYRGIVIVSLAIIIAAAYYWFAAEKGAVDLVLRLPEKIIIGRPFSFDVGIANNADAVLGGAKLTITLPPGMAFVGSSEEKNVDVRSVGDIGVKSFLSQEFTLIALKDPGSVKTIEAVFQYSHDSAQPRFELKKTFAVPLGDKAIELVIDAPAQAMSNDEFEIKVLYKNVSNEDFENLNLKIEYPPVFKFLDATLKPDNADNFWRIGRLNRGAEGKFSIFGQLIAPPRTLLDFKGILKLTLSNQEYAISDQLTTVTIGESPFQLRLEVNNDPNFIAHAGDQLQYTAIFSEQLDTLRVQLTGEMFDWSGGGDGVFVWQNVSSPITFSAKVKKDYPLKRLGDKNFLLKANAEGRKEKNISVAKLETKVGGALRLTVKGYFRDAQTGILNKGPLPPQVGQTTNFTIHWLLSNFGTDVKAIKIKTALPESVIFTGISKSDLNSAPVYNPQTKEIIWEIDRLLATQGAIEKPLEAIFQIAATPQPALVGSYIPLLTETQVTALDEFTGLTLSQTNPVLTSALPDDPTVGQQGAVVKYD